MSMSTHLADRVRRFLADRRRMAPLPRRRARMARGAGPPLAPAPARRIAGRDLPSRRPPFHGRIYSFEGWNAHQSLGMLLTKRMENAGLKPLGFVANDYALACYGLEPVTDPRALLSPDILEARVRRLGRAVESAQARLPRSGGDRRAGRAPHPGKRKIGPPGQLLDRPHLRRAAPLRARASAAARRLERCPRPHDRARPPGPAGRPRRGDHGPCRRSSGSRRWRCR